MKKIILLFAICFSTFLVKAQGNLQFSATKLIILSKQLGQVSADTVVTIPPGKTWKIEKTTLGEYNGSRLKMNGVVIGQIQNITSGYYAIYTTSVDGPLWIPEGTYTFSFYCGGGSSASDNCLISAIEFNIIP